MPHKAIYMYVSKFFDQKWIYLEYSYWLKLSNYKKKTIQWKESRQETSQILEHCRNHNKIGLISSKSTGFKGIPRIKSNTDWSVLCSLFDNVLSVNNSNWATMTTSEWIADNNAQPQHDSYVCSSSKLNLFQVQLLSQNNQ